MASRSCQDFTVVGSHFRSGVRGFLTSASAPTPTEFTLVYCMGTTAVGVGGLLSVDVLAPDVATATGSSCLDIGPTTAAAGTYCLWVVNPDGGERAHTGITVVVTE